ncbi:NAD(P)H-dependent oxidoreductase [Paenibacillus hunanensis]|uniref:NADPH-dependent FMN reductase n=1 Tax=Paenibacillus hunanensis TaxID=539262 RepID=UPI002026BBEA|nr:NADPH-dependent FMN reductase [Paenibacillus hunanensis]MCL9661487.1 NAD(P)H-dependent oxidoreductase [Paenibacillus hunanensis]
MNHPFRILAISGSLRQSSSNTLLMNAMIGLAPSQLIFTTYTGLGDLPHFNPDLDTDHGPLPVQHLRTQIDGADGVLICSPEYGNGVPGALKNALDWIVSSGEFVNKPTAVITASPSPLGGNYANESLLLTLQMINAQVSQQMALTIPHITLKLSKDGTITDPALKQSLKSILQALQQACY